MTLAISAAHNTVRLQGTLAFADSGAQSSRIRLYASARPATGGDPLAASLVEIVLAKPCGEINAGVLTLVQAEAGGDLIAQTGSVLWARWVNGDEMHVADGSVSDAAGDGDFKVSGTTGTMLYAGARALLGISALS
jgi:hypothetical protein